MFIVDETNMLRPLQMYLVKPDGTILQRLKSGVDESTASFSVSKNQEYDFSFTIHKYINNPETGDKTLTPGYDYIVNGIYIALEKIGLFRAKTPDVTYDGTDESKSVTAYGCSCELEDKNLNSIKINTGETTSLEYLVEYDDGETELLINPYTNIPYDWIVLYNTFPDQLQILKTKYNENYFGEKDAENKVTITDADKIGEIEKISNTISRLKSKIVEQESDEVITYQCIEYITFIKNESDEITSIVLGSGFSTRIDELITFYGKYRSQLSLFDIVLSKTGGNWSVGSIYGLDSNDYTISNKKFQFEINENIYSFLTGTLEANSKCITQFNIKNRTVNLSPAEDLGNDTGIVFGFNKIINSIDYSCDDDDLNTRLYVYGNDDLGIEYVNFGLPYIEDLTYKMNSVDSNGNRIYVSDVLAEKYNSFVQTRESNRDIYISLTKSYNKKLSEINEIKYREPNDDLKTDWGTFSLDDLNDTLNEYNKLLLSLKALYKEDYGDAGLNEDGSINEPYIKNTFYWYDYEAYIGIIDQINIAIATFPNYDDQDKWSDENVSEYKELISAWETEWTLYGAVELQAKIDSYKNVLESLSDTVLVDDNGNPKCWDLSSETGKETWTITLLVDDEKQEYGNDSTVYNIAYEKYVQNYLNKLSAQTYLDLLTTQLSTLQSDIDSIETQRLNISKSVSIENNFTEYEIKVLNLLYKDATYTNDNIVTTSLDTEEEKVDIQYSLLLDAKEELSKECIPQINFRTSIENIFGLIDFEPQWDSFNIFNFIRIQLEDNSYAKVRIVSYRFNPLIPESKDFEVTFSNFVKSLSSRNDISSLLSDTASSSSSSTGNSSSSGSDYGESNDIDITISNTMLSKLLNTESFGSTVSDIVLDTIDAKTISAKNAKFGSLADGTTKINGKCIETGYIKDASYNGTSGGIDNTSGSILNLDDGKFNFAAGKLTYDGSNLIVNGYTKVSDLETGMVVVNGSCLQPDSITEDKISTDYTTTLQQNITDASDVANVAKTIADNAKSIAIESQTTANDVQDRADNGDFDPITIYIHSSEGTSFKNNDISTEMSITIYHGINAIIDQPGLESDFGSGAYLEWSIRKYGDSTFTTIISTDSHLSNNGFLYTVGSDDIDTQAVFNVKLIVP